jgi:hypothetical protein
MVGLWAPDVDHRKRGALGLCGQIVAEDLGEKSVDYRVKAFLAEAVTFLL